MLVLEKSYAADSGGAGRTRGGLGSRLRFRKLDDDGVALLAGIFPEGYDVEQPGLFGGTDRLDAVGPASSTGEAARPRTAAPAARSRSPTPTRSSRCSWPAGPASATRWSARWRRSRTICERLRHGRGRRARLRRRPRRARRHRPPGDRARSASGRRRAGRRREGGAGPPMRVATDVGGTFTDLVYCDYDRPPAAPGRGRGQDVTPRPPSSSAASCRRWEARRPCRPPPSTSFAHGTTVVINALTERKGAHRRPDHDRRLPGRPGDRARQPPGPVQLHVRRSRRRSSRGISGSR